MLDRIRLMTTIYRTGIALLLITLGFLLGLWQRPVVPPAPPPPASLARANPEPGTPPLHTSPSRGTPQAPFHWSQVESPEYPVYIANLRAIGCPELTVRDIIVADVNQLFAPRYVALARDVPGLSWWTKQDPRRPLPASVQAQLSALNLEKRQLLERLLGKEALAGVEALDLGAVGVQDQQAWSFLPAVKRAGLQQIMSRYDTLLEWGRTQWKGLPTDQREAKLKELWAARLNELRQLLNPDELEEFQLRNSPAASDLREQYGKSDLTEAEFRQLYALRREFEERHPDPTSEDWKQHEGSISQALGPTRVAELEKQNNRMWQAMKDLTAIEGVSLTPAVLEDAYQVQREFSQRMVKAVGVMFSDPQQDPTPLWNLAAEMEGKLKGLLGEEAVDQLNRRGALPRLVVQTDGTKRTYSFSPPSGGD